MSACRWPQRLAGPGGGERHQKPEQHQLPLGPGVGGGRATPALGAGRDRWRGGRCFPAAMPRQVLRLWGATFALRRKQPVAARWWLAGAVLMAWCWVVCRCAVRTFMSHTPVDWLAVLDHRLAGGLGCRGPAPRIAAFALHLAPMAD